MFKQLNEEIIRLNNSAKTIANCEKAKRLRKKLLSIGIPLTIIGFGGVFICFIAFATAGMDAFDSNGFTPRVLIPFFMFIPCAVVGGIGSSIANLGFKILITGYTTNIIDETVGNNCPNCGDVIDADEFFCTNCGTKLKCECPNCQTINSYKNKYCSRCGKEL